MHEEAIVTKVDPIYDFDRVAGGYFNVYFNHNDRDPFKLSFVPFLDYRLKNSDELYNYLKKRSDDTVSHAIYDLYDIGFPIDEWVEEYIEMVKDKVDADLFNALVMFYNYIKTFPTGSQED